MVCNTTAKDLNLNSGAVSKSIVEVAGQAIQKEVSEQCPYGLRVGEHVTTSAGNMKCRCIFHAVLDKWDGDNGTAQEVGEVWLHCIELLIFQSWSTTFVITIRIVV